MSMDAMKQALDYIKATNKSSSFWLVPASELNKTVTALRLAIEQAEKQEPGCDKDPRGCWNVRCQLGKVCKNTTPPQRHPLTDEEIWREYQALWPFHPQEEPRLAADTYIHIHTHTCTDS